MGVEEDVLWLDVPVKDPLFMGKLKCLADPGHDRQGGGRVQSPGRHRLTQVHTLDVLQHQEAEAAGQTKVVNSHDARVVKPGQRPGFPLETVQEPGWLVVTDRQDLQRHRATQLGLSGQKDKPHATPPDEADDLQLGKSSLQRREIGWGRLGWARVSAGGFGRPGEQAPGTQSEYLAGNHGPTLRALLRRRDRTHSLPS